MNVFSPTFFLGLHTREALSFKCAFNHLVYNIPSNQNRFVICEHVQRRDILLQWENRQFCEILAIYLSKWAIIHWTTVRSHCVPSILVICALMKAFVSGIRLIQILVYLKFTFDKMRYIEMLIKRIQLRNKIRMQSQVKCIFFNCKNINHWENNGVEENRK